jgi:peroxiredoxin
MNDDSRAWLIQQLKGLVLIGALSLLLAISVNAFRRDGIPWVDTRRMMKAGDTLPHFPIPPPADPTVRKYLGLPSDKETTTISSVQADLLVMEVLNVYCFACQSQALAFNDVYQLIQKRPELRKRIKLIGVAIGNNQEEADDFRREYGLSFPVIPDSEGLSSRLMGPDLPPPFSVYVRRDASGKLGLVIGTHEGVIEDQRILFDGLVKILDMEPDSKHFRELFRHQDRTT